MIPITIEYLDRKLLELLLRKGWKNLREDFIEHFLKMYGIDLERWELSTKIFYLAGTVKTKDGKEFRIWKPITDITALLNEGK